jgi:hypothetical protein
MLIIQDIHPASHMITNWPLAARFLLTSAIHTMVKSSLIMRLSCGNILKSIRGAAPFGCRAHQAFPQVICSARS